jgi:hypothetical protein
MDHDFRNISNQDSARWHPIEKCNNCGIIKHYYIDGCPELSIIGQEYYMSELKLDPRYIIKNMSCDEFILFTIL